MTEKPFLQEPQRSASTFQEKRRREEMEAARDGPPYNTVFGFRFSVFG
jgi:hypothetical protein